MQNNQSMQTVVETFFVEETQELIHDNEQLAKWNNLVAELELKGQSEVIKDDKSPIPFLWMNSAIVNAFSVLCPTKVKVEDYNKTPIPVQILELVSLCKKEGYFDVIKVWYNEKDKDPVVVGYANEPSDSKYGGQDWHIERYAQKYLIGRWADVKASLDQLVDRAKKVFTHSETIRLKKEIRDRQRQIEDLESEVERNFGGAMPTTDLPF